MSEQEVKDHPLYKKLEQQYANLHADYLTLKCQSTDLKRQMFGRRSERYVPEINSVQTSLDLLTETNSNQPETTAPKSSPKKKSETSGHGRGVMPTNLPVEKVVIEPEEKTDTMRKIGEETSWEYDWTPGILKVKQYIRPKYVESTTNEIHTASLPPRFIDKGNISAALGAHIVTEKFLYHIPLYRQIQKFEREHGIVFAESTLCDVVSRAAFWLESVFHELKKRLLQATYVQADETTMKVLEKRAKGKTHKGYFWAYHDPLKKIILFDYQKGRGHDVPGAFLKDFSGTLQADGYQAYDKLGKKEGILRSSCMAHVRRYFEKALSNDRLRAEYALEQIKLWFMVEREAKELEMSAEQRLALRERHDLRGAFEEFRDWMMKTVQETTPSDLIRKACEYGLGQWKGFDAYLADGRIELSTNLLEAQIRPIALGRKNYLFKGSHDAAQRAAMIYSIIATAKAHEIEPHKYIRYLLTNLPNANSADLEHFLPYNFAKSAGK